MANEITIIIKARKETEKTFEELKLESLKAGEEAGRAYKEGFKEGAGKLEEDPEIKNSGAKVGDELGQEIHDHVTEKISEVKDDPAIETSGHDIGDRLGSRMKEGLDHGFGDALQKRFNEFASGKFEEKVKVKFDENTKRSWSQDMESALRDGFRGAASEVGNAFSNTKWNFGSLAAYLVPAIIAFSPALGAAISAGLGLAIGGGVVATGIVAGLKNPFVHGALIDFKNRAGKIFHEFGQFFTPALLDFFNGNGKTGGMIGLLKQLQPELQKTGQVLGPVADKIGNGLVGFLSELMPRILDASRLSAPLLTVLADDLPRLGNAIGAFFKTIAKNSPETAIFFDDLINQLIGVLDTLAQIISFLTKMYLTAKWAALNIAGVFVNEFARIITAADKAFGWIPGIGPKLHKAAKDAQKFAGDINRDLAQIHGREVEIRIRTVFIGVGNVLANLPKNLFGGKASGGITGSANGASPSGLTWVGEHGPELMDAPAGSRIYSHGDSQRMAGGLDGAGGTMIVQLHLDGRVLAQAMVDPQRKFVQQNFGGNVQRAYGMGA